MIFLDDGTTLGLLEEGRAEEIRQQGTAVFRGGSFFAAGMARGDLDDTAKSCVGAPSVLPRLRPRRP